MNQRYKDLWDQTSKLESDPSWAGQTRFMEKYAELIVKECSYLADQAHYKATNGKSAGGYIRQQFGVEQ